MNFKAYINDCRLREMEALLAGSTYAGESMTGLAIRAGFGCYHSYRRAKKEILQISKKITISFHPN